MLINSEPFRKKLEEIGERSVREKLSIPEGHFKAFNYIEKGLAEVWLLEREQARTENSKIKELSIANEANKISKDANRVAWLSAGIAALSLIFSIMALTK